MSGDWEGPIDLHEFGQSDEGWVKSTTGYAWHPVLGGGIFDYGNEAYQNWDYDYEPMGNEIEPIERENKSTGETVEDLQLQLPQQKSMIQSQPQTISEPTQETPVASHKG